MKRKIAVFASGNGTNFEALANACADGRLDAEIVLCVTDKPGAYVVERARRHDVPTIEFRPKDFASKAEFETMLVNELRSRGVELICLAGYMRIIGDVLLENYGGRIINIHPSLLPAFRGADAIGQALEYGVKVFGVTIHYVDATLDGGKIISQVAVAYDGSDREELEPLIHAQEHILYPRTVARILDSLPHVNQ